MRLRLLAVPGIAQVSVYGGDLRAFQVQVRPHDLIRFRLGLNDVLLAARKATGVRGAGFVDTANQRIALQTEGQSLTPEEIARTVLINEGGASVVLGDVATVTVAPEPPIGAASVDGRPGVLLMVGAQIGANTLEATRRVEAALAELRPGLERDGIVVRADLFRPANFIAQANGNVLQALALGGILVVVVLFVFLFDWRTAIISAVAIPLSLLAAVLVLGAMGESLNTMTLGGLAIAIGEVVDDAVIGIENAVRRLRENGRLPAPLPVGRVVRDAILEVRGAVAYATFAVLLVFLPVLALTGVAGAPVRASGARLHPRRPGLARGGAHRHPGPRDGACRAQKPARARSAGDAGLARRLCARARCRRSGASAGPRPGPCSSSSAALRPCRSSAAPSCPT